MLHLPLGAANLILKLPARVLKSIVDGKCQIGMPLIGRWRPFHIHLAAIRKRKTNMDLVKSAGPVMLTRSFQHHAAGGHTTPALFEFRNMLLDSSYCLHG